MTFLLAFAVMAFCCGAFGPGLAALVLLVFNLLADAGEELRNERTH